MTFRATQLLLALVVIASGCQNGGSSAASPADLRALVGHRVHLQGRFGGPGKLADYVTVPGGQIYLFDPAVVDEAKPQYGNIIAVEGLLSYRSYPPSTEPESGVQVARPPDHYLIERAKVRVVHPPGGAP